MLLRVMAEGSLSKGRCDFVFRVVMLLAQLHQLCRCCLPCTPFGAQPQHRLAGLEGTACRKSSHQGEGRAHQSL